LSGQDRPDLRFSTLKPSDVHGFINLTCHSIIFFLGPADQLTQTLH